MAGGRRSIVWSPEAEADLFDVWNYYAQVAGPQTADNIVREISEACRMLEDHPHAGRSRDEIGPGPRSVVASPYVVFYHVKDDVAQLVRILDGRRDIDDIFADGAAES